MQRKLLLVAGAALAFFVVAVGPTVLGGGIGTGLGLSLDFGTAMDRGFLLALAVVFMGGVLTSLTPCVYPLIPVTVAVFGALGDEGRLRSMALSTSYVLGMAATYSMLGLVAALTGRLLGSLMTSIWMMGGIALLLVVMAASMLGAFELKLPAGLQTRLSQVGGEGLLGAFSMGLVAGVIAAPCTGPVLGGVLAYVATTEDILLGALLLFVFAIGMGLLFWVIGTFSMTLPKSGPWMEGIKSLFAVVMLVAALWFLKDAVPQIRSVLVSEGWVPWAAGTAVAVGILLGGIHRSFAEGWRSGALKSAGVLLIVAGSFLRVGETTVLDESLRGAIDWVHDEGRARALAADEGRPLLIDFRADWCSACIDLERHTFPHPVVAEEAKRFVACKVDATDDLEPSVSELLSRYEINGLPTVLFIDSRGRERRDLRIERFVPPREMLRRMRAVE